MSSVVGFTGLVPQSSISHYNIDFDILSSWKFFLQPRRIDISSHMMTQCEFTLFRGLFHLMHLHPFWMRHQWDVNNSKEMRLLFLGFYPQSEILGTSSFLRCRNWALLFTEMSSCVLSNVQSLELVLWRLSWVLGGHLAIGLENPATHSPCLLFRQESMCYYWKCMLHFILTASTLSGVAWRNH